MFLDTAAVIHDDGHAADGAGPVLSRFDPGDLFGLGGRALRLRRCRLPGWYGFLYGSRLLDRGGGRLRGRRLGSRFLCRGRGLDGHPLPGRRCCLGRCCCLRGRLCDSGLGGRGCAFCNRHKYPPGMINIIKTERSQLRFMEEETENKPLPSERNGRLGGRLKTDHSPAYGRGDTLGGGLDGGRRYFFLAAALALADIFSFFFSFFLNSVPISSIKAISVPSPARGPTFMIRV